MSASEAEYRHWQAHGGLFDLASRAKVKLTGVDRVRYLNGQVTANVMSLQPGRALAACVTTAKGKLSAEVRISATADALFLDAEPESREGLLARLERYIVADDVTVEDVTDMYGLWHLVGSEARLEEVPLEGRRSARFGASGWDFWIESAAAGVERTLFTEGGPHLISAELAETIRLEAGVPRWGRELGEDTLPPEAGLERTHIDYAKGCYIGQEVISRLKSVGHVNRHLAGFVSTTGEALHSGWSLFAPGVLEKGVGHLTSAAWSFALAKPMALGYLKRQAPSGALLAQPADRSLPAVEVALLTLPLPSSPLPS